MTDRNTLLLGVSPRAMTFAPASSSALLRGPQIAYAPDEGGGDGGGGALSIEQATNEILGATSEPDTSADDGGGDADAGGDDDHSGAETSGDENDDAGAAEPDDDVVDDEAEPVEEPVAALDAPAYWSKEAKAEFAALPANLQAVVLAQEGPREAAAAKAKADAATEVQTARAQVQQVQTLAEQLQTFLPEAIDTFKQRWGEPDWEATIQQYGAQDAALMRARYDKEQSQLATLAQQTKQAQTQAFNAYQVEQIGVLATLDPELVPDAKDPAKGAEKRLEVTNYLLKTGIGRDAVMQISAAEMALARKAMLWDRAEAARKAGKTGQARPAIQPQRAATPRPGARPGASAATPIQSQGRASSQNAFNAKPSIDNAVALLMARSKR